MSVKFNKAKVVKSGTSLTSKGNETWFAVKGPLHKHVTVTWGGGG